MLMLAWCNTRHASSGTLTFDFDFDFDLDFDFDFDHHCDRRAALLLTELLLTESLFVTVLYSIVIDLQGEHAPCL
jgi:hypothetical protein